MLQTLFEAKLYSMAIEKLMHGDFEGCEKKISEVPPGSRDYFSEEFIKANLSFQRSKLKYFNTSNAYNFYSFLILFFPLLDVIAHAHEWLIQMIFKNYSKKRFVALYKRDICELIFCRYTNFSKGLLVSRRLFWASRWLGEKPIEQLYLEGLVAHFECLGGQFDIGLARMAACVEALRHDYQSKEALQLNTSIEYFYLAEIMAIRCLHLGYAGHFDQSDNEYNRTITMLQIRPYAFVEVYARSMRMYLSLEQLDSDKIEADAKWLKETLGASHFEYYALRVSAFSSLISRIKNDILTSKMHESICNRHYTTTSSPIELGRYHFLRGLIDLEKGDAASAVINTKRALSFFSPIPGAYFHQLDGMLLYAEIQLRAIYLKNQSPSSSEAKRALTKIKWIIRVAKFLAPSSQHLLQRTKVLMAYYHYLKGNYTQCQVVAPDADELQRLRFNRLNYILMFIQSSGGKPVFLSPSVKNSAAIFESSFSETLLKAFSQENLMESCCQLLSTILGGASCSVVEQVHAYNSDVNQAARIDIISFDHEACIIEFRSDYKTLRFTVGTPENNPRFDTEVATNLQITLACFSAAFFREEFATAKLQQALVQHSTQVAHDIRSPLSAIDIVLRRPGQLQNPESIALIKAALHRIKDIANSLLTAHRRINFPEARAAEVTAGDDAIRPEALDILAQGIVDEKATSSSENMITLVLQKMNNCAAISKINSTEFQRVLSNLINNAEEAITKHKRPGIIKVTIQESGDSNLVCVIDDGCGIPKLVLKKLDYTPTTYNKCDGNGLGLKYAQEHVRAWGGTIAIESEVGQGTAVTIRLPKATLARA